MKTWRIGRLVIAWGRRVEKRWRDFRKLMSGDYHIAKNPPKGVKRKRREQDV